MLALVHFGHGLRQIDMPFRDFLFSGFLSPHARAAMCDPEDLVRDHLPAFDPDDEEETSEAFREACEQATGGETTGVRLDHADIAFARRRLVDPDACILHFPHPLGAA
jgi:hypothetical protein